MQGFSKKRRASAQIQASPQSPPQQPHHQVVLSPQENDRSTTPVFSSNRPAGIAWSGGSLGSASGTKSVASSNLSFGNLPPHLAWEEVIAKGKFFLHMVMGIVLFVLIVRCMFL